jgi:hypothetical protein
MRPVLLVGLAALASCGGGGRVESKTGAEAGAAAAKESRPASTTITSAVEPVRVELIKAGNRPYRELRYALAPDRLGTLTTLIDSDTAIRNPDGSQVHLPSPPMEMDMEVTSLELAGERAVATFRITRFDVVTSPSDATDEKTRAAIQERLQMMVGITGSWTSDTQGRMIAMTWNTPKTLPEITRAVLDSMSQSSQQMTVPLPDEPVGAGAEWYAIQEVAFLGMKLSRSSRFTLAELRGDQVRLTCAVELSAVNQTFSLPGLPTGTRAEMLSFEGNGSADAELDLGHALPLRMTVASRANMTMAVTAGGQRQTFGMEVTTRMDMKRR